MDDDYEVSPSAYAELLDHPHLEAASADFCSKYLASFDTQKDTTRLIFVILFMLSITGLIFIATTIMFNKKLQSHPQPLIAWICVAEACMSYNALMEVINPVVVICYTSSYRVFGWTLFKSVSTQDEMENMANIQCQGN